ncbi:hypothetical protein HHI36_018972, partial [Cryptolaemus montrouzieri]
MTNALTCMAVRVAVLMILTSPEYYRDAPHFHRVDLGPEYRLEIPNAKIDFTGTYTVYAKNCHGEAKAIISLQIKVKEDTNAVSRIDKTKISEYQTIPSIKRDLKDIRCCDGDSVVFECEIEGTPIPDVRWERGGKLVHLGGDFNADLDGTIARLSIKQVYPEDEAEYTCVAFNELGRATTSACLVVDIPEEKGNILTQQLQRPAGHTLEHTPISTSRATPIRSLSPRVRPRERTPGYTTHRRVLASVPKFYTIPHNRIAEEGETVKFQCAVAGFPDPYTIWEKNGIIVTPNTKIRISEMDDLRILELTDVTRQDAGTYKIILENEVGRVEASARLDIVFHRNNLGVGTRTRARSLSPRVSAYGRGLTGSTALLGSNSRLHCDIRAVPTHFLKWYKDGIPLENSERFHSSSDGHKVYLDIAQVTEDDSGVYKCVVDESIEASTYLKVYDTFTVTEHLPVSVSASEGEAVSLRLRLSSVNDIDVIWMKDGCVVPDCNEFKQRICDDGVIEMFIANPSPLDAGNYRCEIFAPNGDVMSKCTLVVEEREATFHDVEFVKQPSPVIATEGSTVSFCARLRQSDYKIRYHVQWEVGGSPILNSSRFIVEEDSDVNILHIVRVTHRDAGTVKCLVRRPSTQSHSCANQAWTNSAVLCSCDTELTVVSDISELGDHPYGRTMEVIGGDDANFANKVRKPVMDEPAILLRGPQDTTALVGDRVLLKATYMGHPEPIVRWSRA